MTLPGSGRAMQALLCCSACKYILNFGSAARRDWGAGKKGNYRRTLRAMLCLHCDTAAVRRPVRTARTATITIRTCRSLICGCFDFSQTWICRNQGFAA